MPDTTLSRLAAEAHALAARVLADKTDKAGMPLIRHASRVAEAASKEGHDGEDSLELYVLGILHDTIEDGPEGTEEEVKELLERARVRGRLMPELYALTRRRGVETYAASIVRAGAFWQSRVVKMADLRDNLAGDRRKAISEDLVGRYSAALGYLEAIHLTGAGNPALIGRLA